MISLLLFGGGDNAKLSLDVTSLLVVSTFLLLLLPFFFFFSFVFVNREIS